MAKVLFEIQTQDPWGNIHEPGVREVPDEWVEGTLNYTTKDLNNKSFGGLHRLPQGAQILDPSTPVTEDDLDEHKPISIPDFVDPNRAKVEKLEAENTELKEMVEKMGKVNEEFKSMIQSFEKRLDAQEAQKVEAEKVPIKRPAGRPPKVRS